MSHPALRWPLSVPVLSDGVVTLRAHRPEDVDPMHEMGLDDQMQRWTAISIPTTREQTEHFALTVVPRGWDDGTARGWAIELDGRYAGNIDIRGNGVAEIGFGLHPWARGRGAMVRAVRLAVDWTFTEGVAEVVHWRAHVGNVASLRVAHAAGFALHGTQPGMLWERQRAIDAWTATVRFGDAPLPRTRWIDDVIVIERLRIRPFVHADLPGIAEACSDPTTRHWLAGMPSPYTEQSAREFVDSAVWDAALGVRGCWAVADRATDALLGNIAVMHLTPPDPSQGEIGYWTHPAARGRGVMTEAVRAVVSHAFAPDGLGLRRLSLYAAAGNGASNAVARAAGFSATGRETAAELLGDGTYDDLLGYELLR